MVNAQEYLDNNYPKNERKNITTLDLSNQNLEGDLDLSDFVNLEELDCSGNNSLAKITFPRKTGIVEKLEKGAYVAGSKMWESYWGQKSKDEEDDPEKKTLISENEELKDRNEELEEENTKKEERIAKLELENLEAKNRELEVEKTQLEQDKKKLGDQVKDLEEKLRKKEIELEEKENAYQEIKLELERLEKGELDSLSTEEYLERKKELKQKADELISELGARREDKKQCEKELGETNERLEKKEKEITDLQGKLIENESLLENKKRGLEEAERKILDRQVHGGKKTPWKPLKDEVNRLKKEVRELESQKVKDQQEITNRTEELGKEKESIQNEKNLLEKRKKNIEEEEKSLQTQFDSYKEKLEDLSKEFWKESRQKNELVKLLKEKNDLEKLVSSTKLKVVENNLGDWLDTYLEEGNPEKVRETAKKNLSKVLTEEELKAILNEEELKARTEDLEKQTASLQNQERQQWFAPQRWLTDDEIDWAMGQMDLSNYRFDILESAYFTSLQNRDETTQQGFLSRLNDLESELVFIPVNDNNAHWSLLVYQPSTRTFYHYDTSHGLNSNRVERLLWQVYQDSNDYNLEHRYDIQQGNGHDCGVAVIAITERIIQHGLDTDLTDLNRNFEPERTRWRERVQLQTVTDEISELDIQETQEESSVQVQTQVKPKGNN